MRLTSISISLFLLCSFLPARNRIKEYYRLIYAAEAALCKEDYMTACDYYTAAFKKKEPFYADIRNAFTTSLLTKDSLRIRYFWTLTSQHPDLVYELKNNQTALRICSPALQKQIAGYNRTRSVTAFERLIDSVRNVDQQARHECPNNMKAACKERFYKTDSANIHFIASLLRTTGYSESIHGEQSLKSCFLIGWHARRWGFTELDAILYELVKKGRIKPSLPAQLIEYKSDIDSINKRYLDNSPDLGFESTCIVIGPHLIEMNQTDSSIAAINKNRSRYFLDNVLNDINKNTLILKNPLFNGKAGDFNLNLFNQNMAEEEFKQFLNSLTQMGAVKKWWF